MEWGSQPGARSVDDRGTDRRRFRPRVVVELAARPSFRDAPAAEVVFEIREIKGNP